MARLSKKGLFGFALVLSAVLAVLLYQYLSAPPAGQTVIVAKTDISPKTVITESMVKEVSVPKDYIQPGALQDKKSVIGGITRESIVSGEQITSRRLVIAGKTAGFTGLIPQDKRAMTIAVTDETGVAGFAKAGDFIDVIVTLDEKLVGQPISHTILQNILVLAANRDSEENSSGTASEAKKSTVKTTTYTLAVNPTEALKLAIGDEKGKIRLVLRPFMPSEKGIITTSVTPRDLLGENVPLATVVSNAKQESSYSVAEDYYVPQESSVNSSSISGSSASSVNSIQMIRGTKVETISLQ